MPRKRMVTMRIELADEAVQVLVRSVRIVTVALLSANRFQDPIVVNRPVDSTRRPTSPAHPSLTRSLRWLQQLAASERLTANAQHRGLTLILSNPRGHGHSQAALMPFATSARAVLRSLPPTTAPHGLRGPRRTTGPIGRRFARLQEQAMTSPSALRRPKLVVIAGRRGFDDVSSSHAVAAPCAIERRWRSPCRSPLTGAPRPARPPRARRRRRVLAPARGHERLVRTARRSPSRSSATTGPRPFRTLR